MIVTDPELLDEALPVVTLFDCAAVLEPLLVLPLVAGPPLPPCESAVPEADAAAVLVPAALASGADAAA